MIKLFASFFPSFCRNVHINFPLLCPLVISLHHLSAASVASSLKFSLQKKTFCHFTLKMQNRFAYWNKMFHHEQTTLVPPTHSRSVCLKKLSVENDCRLLLLPLKFFCCLTYSNKFTFSLSSDSECALQSDVCKQLTRAFWTSEADDINSLTKLHHGCHRQLFLLIIEEVSLAICSLAVNRFVSRSSLRLSS